MHVSIWILAGGVVDRLRSGQVPNGGGREPGRHGFMEGYHDAAVKTQARAAGSVCVSQRTGVLGGGGVWLASWEEREWIDEWRKVVFDAGFIRYRSLVSSLPSSHHTLPLAAFTHAHTYAHHAGYRAHPSVELVQQT